MSTRLTGVTAMPPDFDTFELTAKAVHRGVAGRRQPWVKSYWCRWWTSRSRIKAWRKVTLGPAGLLRRRQSDSGGDQFWLVLPGSDCGQPPAAATSRSRYPTGPGLACAGTEGIRNAGGVGDWKPERGTIGGPQITTHP